MEHLDFINELDNTGIMIKQVSQKRRIIISRLFNNNTIIIKDNQLEWEQPENSPPLKALISNAIDMDDWKHSIHTEIIPENYDKILEIIQRKIINRVEEINVLLTTYNQLKYQNSKIYDEEYIKGLRNKAKESWADIEPDNWLKEIRGDDTCETC